LSEILPIQHTDAVLVGIKEYSEWPTIPQLYVDKEFIGGCDILMTMHQDGSLAKMLEEKGVVVPAEGEQKP
jgi:monothiol glutaredoxin